jgi:hypothetical protein
MNTITTAGLMPPGSLVRTGTPAPYEALSRSETGSASHTASIAVDNVTAEAIRDEDKYGSVRIRLVARLASAREP